MPVFGKAVEAARGDHRGHSILQEGMSIRGELDATGDVRLDGHLEGKISVSDRLTIGEGGNLVADVVAGEVVVMGSIQGNIQAHRRIEIRKGAVVVGDVTTPVLVIEEGVRFHGHSNMSAEGSGKPILQMPESPIRDPRPNKETYIGVDA
jgi:cytoskeletal protein CcmA (bactofilin family)